MSKKDVEKPNKNTLEECIASEEYAAISENILSSPALPTFHKRKHDIFRRLQTAVSQCNIQFSGRKELATEQNKHVANLCDTLEIAFQYGLIQQQQQQLPNLVASAAANLFQNMHEIVTGTSKSILKATNTTTAFTDPCFWDFCKVFLTAHERQRFTELKQTWTKWGKGRAFIRASLNEHSLHRYILTWISDRQMLHAHYNKWALLTDETITSSLPDLIKSLDNVLFALVVDKTELNSAIKTYQPASDEFAREEPVIYAPTPVKIEPKVKGKSAIVERPIQTFGSTEDLLQQLQVDTDIIRSEYPENGCTVSEIIITEETESGIKESSDPIPFINANATGETKCEPSNDVEAELKLLKKTFLEFSSTLPSSDDDLNKETPNSGECIATSPELQTPLPNGDVNDICVEKELESLKKIFKEFTTTLPSEDNKIEAKSPTLLCYSDSNGSPNELESECNNPTHLMLQKQLREANKKCSMLDTKVAELTLENIQLMMRLKKYMDNSKIKNDSLANTNT
uniref:RUN domain-containing protein n=1 Tax=Musca domestica TaxID=7370 RepID=A0A1I8M6T6_MUSDO